MSRVLGSVAPQELGGRSLPSISGMLLVGGVVSQTGRMTIVYPFAAEKGTLN